MENTYVLDVPELGAFTIRKRTMRHEIAIASEINKLVDGQENLPQTLKATVTMLATVIVLVAKGPDKWDPYNSDPEDPESFEKVMRLFVAIREREQFFRTGALSRDWARISEEGGVEVPQAMESAVD
jgi:hypothetical protein